MSLKIMFFCSVFFLTILPFSADASSLITGLDFKNEKGNAKVVLSYKGKGSFKTLQGSSGLQIIVQATGFDIPAKLTKLIDAASSSGPIMQITPYKSGEGKNALTKIVIQLKKAAKVVPSELSDRYVVEIIGETKAEPMAAGLKVKNYTYDKRNNWSETDSLNNHSGAPVNGSKISNLGRDQEEAKVFEKLESADRNDIAKITETTKKLMEVLSSSEEPKNYFGQRVTFSSEKANVFDIFAMASYASGLNIVADDDVQGSVSISVVNVPWDQILDIALAQTKLKAIASGNVIRIMTMASYTNEQDIRLKNLALVEEIEPVIMAVVPLSYASGTEMKAMIDALLVTPSATNPVGVAAPVGTTATGATAAQVNNQQKLITQSFQKGKIEIDNRSNSLVITNTRSAIDRIRRLIKELDVALPQILIDAKIVLASESFSKAIGIGYGGKVQSESGRAGVSIGMLGSAGDAVSGTSLNGTTAATNGSFTASSPADGIGTMFRLGSGPLASLGAALQLGETNGLSKTVASPRVIVNNKTAASITDGTKIIIPTTAESTTGGTTTSLTTIDVGLNLSVTPQVTSAGSVLLKVAVQQSKPGGVAGNVSADSSTINTEVLVDSGNTLVLGGVYSSTEKNDELGIPMLKDLPFFGQLFRKNIKSITKSELMVFITPQIMEPTGNSPLVHEVSSNGSSSGAM